MNNNFIHETAIIDRNVSFGEDVKVWHFAHIRENVTIGDNVLIGKSVYIDKNVVIPEGCRIQNSVNIYEGVYFEKWCFVGPGVVFTNDLTPRAGASFWEISKTFLKRGCSVGAGAIIRSGITIGEFSMIAAGAIVTKDVLPFHVVAGTPAVAISKTCFCGKQIFELNDSRWSKNCGKCSENLNVKAWINAEY